METVVFETIYKYYPRYCTEDSVEHRNSVEYQTFRQHCEACETSHTLIQQKAHFLSRLKINFPDYPIFALDYPPFIHSPSLNYIIQLTQPPHITELVVRQSILTAACCILFYEYFEWEKMMMSPISSLPDEPTAQLFQEIVQGRISLWDGSILSDTYDALTTPIVRFIPHPHEVPMFETIRHEVKAVFGASVLSPSLLQTTLPDINIFDNLITNEKTTVFQCLFSNLISR